MKGTGRGMAREHYEALIREFPDLGILSAWADDFYENIEKVKEKGPILGRANYDRADRNYYQISGFIYAMYAFGKIDKERRMLLIDEFMKALNELAT